MTNDNRITQLEQRIKELEGYLSQFESFKNYRQRESDSTTGNTAAISTTLIDKPTKTGTRISETWQPSPDVLTWAATSFPAVDLCLEAAKFVDYWVSRSDKGAIKRSWDRTFRNWIRNAATNYRSTHVTSKIHQRPDALDFTTAVRTSFD